MKLFYKNPHFIGWFKINFKQASACEGIGLIKLKNSKYESKNIDFNWR